MPPPSLRGSRAGAKSHFQGLSFPMSVFHNIPPKSNNISLFFLYSCSRFSLFRVIISCPPRLLFLFWRGEKKGQDLFSQRLLSEILHSDNYTLLLRGKEEKERDFELEHHGRFPRTRHTAWKEARSGFSFVHPNHHLDWRLLLVLLLRL